MPSAASHKFYLEKLYPLQDRFFSFLRNYPDLPFYLTGRTALSRFYYHHRFSEDLDFFSLTEIKEFRGCVGNILHAAKRAGFVYEMETVSDHFFRLFLKEKGVSLKIDFVNEIVFHWGEFRKESLFPRVDNEINILANKLTALSRYEVKDIADLWALAKHVSFSWREIIEISGKKSPTDPLEISKIIQSLPAEELLKVKWQDEPQIPRIFNDLQTIAQDILLGKTNSLGLS